MFEGRPSYGAFPKAFMTVESTCTGCLCIVEMHAPELIQADQVVKPLDGLLKALDAAKVVPGGMCVAGIYAKPNAVLVGALFIEIGKLFEIRAQV